MARTVARKPMPMPAAEMIISKFVFNILEKADIFVVLVYPQYTKPRKGNKTGHKDAKWICDLFMCDMIFTISVG